jgi:putative SOS response-associated peptidase YedK
MPCILGRRDEEYWLDPDVTDTTRLAALLKPYNATQAMSYRASRLANDPTNDVPAVLTPYTDAESPQGFPDLT